MNAPATLRGGVDAGEWRGLAESLFAGLSARSADGSGITRECYAQGEQAALDLFR